MKEVGEWTRTRMKQNIAEKPNEDALKTFGKNRKKKKKTQKMRDNIIIKVVWKEKKRHWSDAKQK